jgi:hypothetical protein
MALAILAVVLILAPAAAFHPVVAHLYAAGSSNLSIELTHPSVLGFFAIALVSALPAAGFTTVIVRAARGVPHLHALTQNSRPAHMEDFRYRLLPSEAVLVFTAGLVRPVTFVSAGAERALREPTLRAALLHEEAHRRSKDVIWSLLLGGIGRAFAFVPWIRDVVETEVLRTECAADDYAIRAGARRVDLFDAIVAASGSPADALAVGLTDASVERRLARLIHPEVPLPGRPTTNFLALAAAVAVPAVAAHLIAIAAPWAPRI